MNECLKGAIEEAIRELADGKDIVICKFNFSVFGCDFN